MPAPRASRLRPSVVVLVATSALVFASALAVAALLPPERSSSAAEPLPVLPGSTRVVFVGDIAGGPRGTASFTSASSTAALTAALDPHVIITGGDNAYEAGSSAEFAQNYHPTWGPLRANTMPTPGNHEYETPGASGYYGYFFAGRVVPYHARDLGNRWRGYSLNCEIDCSASSAQYRWLEADLRAHAGGHVLAALHRPRFSSGEHGSDARVVPLWNLLQRHGTDLLLTGHDHTYERFAPQTSSGQTTPAGVRQFVVGTGGVGIRHFSSVVAPNSERRLRSDFGVLLLQLRRGEYWWEFRASGRCADTRNRAFNCPERRGRVLDAGTEQTNLDVRGCARRTQSLWGPLRRICR